MNGSGLVCHGWNALWDTRVISQSYQAWGFCLVDYVCPSVLTWLSRTQLYFSFIFPSLFFFYPQEILLHDIHFPTLVLCFISNSFKVDECWNLLLHHILWSQIIAPFSEHCTYPTITTLNQFAGVFLLLVENPGEWLAEHIQEPDLLIIPHFKTVWVRK